MDPSSWISKLSGNVKKKKQEKILQLHNGKYSERFHRIAAAIASVIFMVLISLIKLNLAVQIGLRAFKHEFWISIAKLLYLQFKQTTFIFAYVFIVNSKTRYVKLVKFLNANWQQFEINAKSASEISISDVKCPKQALGFRQNCHETDWMQIYCKPDACGCQTSPARFFSLFESGQFIWKQHTDLRTTLQFLHSTMIVQTSCIGARVSIGPIGIFTCAEPRAVWIDNVSPGIILFLSGIRNILYSIFQLNL